MPRAEGEEPAATGGSLFHTAAGQPQLPSGTTCSCRELGNVRFPLDVAWPSNTHFQGSALAILPLLI